jgi:hypothetical protein
MIDFSVGWLGRAACLGATIWPLPLRFALVEARKDTSGLPSHARFWRPACRMELAFSFLNRSLGNAVLWEGRLGLCWDCER